MPNASSLSVCAAGGRVTLGDVLLARVALGGRLVLIGTSVARAVGTVLLCVGEAVSRGKVGATVGAHDTSIQSAMAQMRTRVQAHP